MSRVARLPGVAVAVLLAVAILAVAASAQPTSSRASRSAASLKSPACGASGAYVLAHSAGEVATRIYGGELAGAETESDRHQVESYAPLLEAVSSGEHASIEAAVAALVYSHTHIVRLRVTRGATVLADVGGPYILAPVNGTLRVGGRTIAHYVLSVQDDLGYVKLVSRFLGVGLVMRVGSHELPVEGLLASPPASIPANGPLTYRHSRYQAFSFDARSFPGGSLRISLFVPAPSSLAKQSCPAIKNGELGRAAQLIAERFTLTSERFTSYVRFTESLTHGLIYLRSGSHQLAGSTPRGPTTLPNGGTVRYRHRTYEVYSFLAPSSVGQVRIYQLVLP